jgi:hypothetical protein
MSDNTERAAPARIKAILDELARVAAEYAEAQGEWSALFAATHPDRVTVLVMYAGLS